MKATSRQQLRDILGQHRNLHSSSDLGRDHVFSWTQCLISVMSYSLLLSDVLRSGLGIQHIPHVVPLEADLLVSLGPYAYALHHLTTANATQTAAGAFWPYKYDTTSIAMRSFAQFFELPAWPPCLMYKELCDESVGVPLNSVFSMIDELIGAVGAHQQSKRGGATGHVTLRTESLFHDRLHHYALPWFFNPTVKRTNQATHHTYNASGSHTPVCGRTSLKSRLHRPYSCDESWTNYGRVHCSATGLAACIMPTSTIWDHIPKRLALLAGSYPNHSIDYVVLDGMEDFTRSRISFQGRKYFDVVVLTRVQKCDGPSVWQAYTWLRVVLLIRGCYLARSGEVHFRESSYFAKMIATVRTVFLIPSQVVIYGSWLPVTLYMVAHLIDSHANYEIISVHFASTLGIVRFSVSDFVTQCAVSMRTVWIVGFLCHAVLVTVTSRSWSPVHGIPGMAELSITIVASATVFAQFRSVRFRDARVLQVHEVVPSLRHRFVRSETHGLTRTLISTLFFSSAVDTQCLLCAALALGTIMMVLWRLSCTCPRWFRLRVALISRTVVSYSAGTLWPQSCLVVSWFGTLLSKALPAATADDDAYHPPSSTRQPPQRRRVTPAKIHKGPSVRSIASVSRGLSDTADKGFIMRHLPSSYKLQHDLHTSAASRCQEIDAMIYLLNLAVMTDPITFWRLRASTNGPLVALYKFTFLHQWRLLPYALDASKADLPIEWEELQLEAVINTRDLEWCDLLRCG